MAQRDDLHGALEREDRDEDLVDDEQNVLELLRLVVVFDRHRHHVQQDHDHDEYVKRLLGDQLEQPPLRFELYTSSQSGIVGEIGRTQ